MLTMWKVDQNEIFVLDLSGGTGSECECGRDAMFILSIYGQSSHLCEKCFANVGKLVIDGLT